MDTSVVTALAALAGATIGGLTSVLASCLTQRAQARKEQISHYQLRRHELYKEFIEQASKCISTRFRTPNQTFPAGWGFTRKSAECVSCPRHGSSTAPINSSRKLSMHIWSRTSLSQNCRRWRIVG